MTGAARPPGWSAGRAGVSRRMVGQVRLHQRGGPLGLPRWGALPEQAVGRANRQATADQVPDAMIPVDRITGQVLLAAGDDDQVWPSPLFTERIRARRTEHGLATTTLIGAGAGHRIRLPGEPEAAGGAAMARGGSASADAAFGRSVWAELVDLLRLR